VVNNHGLSKSPNDWVVPFSILFQMDSFWLINGGDPNHLLTGTFLQVPAPKKKQTEIGFKENIYMISD